MNIQEKFEISLNDEVLKHIPCWDDVSSEEEAITWSKNPKISQKFKALVFVGFEIGPK